VDEGSIRTIKYRCMMKLRRMGGQVAEREARNERP